MTDATPQPAAPQPAAPQPVQNSNILTIVVVDAKGQPTAGAKVSIKPSDASEITNSAGEAQFTLGTATKYDVTASYGSNTVTVPYYVTKNGATRLVVNPIYVRAIEKQQHPSFFSGGLLWGVGIGLVVIVVGVIAWRMFQTR